MTIPTRRIIVASRTRCMPLSHGAVTGRVVTGRCHDKSMMDDATGSARKINPNQPKSIQINNPVGGFPHICGSLAGKRHSADKLPTRGFGADFENREIPTFLLGDFSQRPRNVTNSRPRRRRIPPNHEFRRVLPRLCGRSAPGTAHRRKLPYRIRTSSSDTPQLAGLPSPPALSQPVAQDNTRQHSAPTPAHGRGKHESPRIRGLSHA